MSFQSALVTRLPHHSCDSSWWCSASNPQSSPPRHRTVVEVGAVGDDRLVLHPQVRGLRHAVLVSPERVGSKSLLEPPQVREDLRHQGPAVFQAFREDPEPHRESLTRDALVLLLQHLVGGDVQRDVVVRDWRRDEPVICARTVSVLLDLLQAPIRGYDQGRRAR